MKKVSSIIIVFSLLLTSLANGDDVKAIRVERLDVPDFVGYVPNEIVVKFDPSITAKMDKTKAPKGLVGIPSLDRLGVSHETISILPQFPKAKKKMYHGKEVDLSGWHKIKFEGKVDVEAVVKEYKSIPGVINAQPIGIHTLYKTPNDPCFDDTYWKQWHLDQVNDADIDAPEAWDIETGYEDIIVAVLDTGVRYFHKDLGGANASLDHPENADGNMWINWAEKDGTTNVDDDGNGYTDDWIGYDFVVDAPEDTCGDLMGIPICPCLSDEDCGITNDGTEVGKDNDPRDFNGHGTHVAGIIAAITNNGYGTASAAGGWGDGSQQAEGNGVKIMPLRICWSANYLFVGEVGLCRMDYAAEALYYAAKNGAKFVNASWGSGDEGGIADAIDYFLADGGILFKAAGNDYGESAPDYINGRTDAGIVSVAATDSSDCRADFSTYGDWVDISAPGVGILSSWHNHDDPANDWIAFLDGTSMATPLALSVAALIKSQNPTWESSQVVQKLYDSADDIYGLPCNSSYAGKLGAGRVNAFNAITGCQGDVEPDGDVDGTDLAAYISNGDTEDLGDFATNFGRVDCPILP